MNDLEQRIKSALTKKAVGYSASEVVEEYQDEEGILRLTKKRVTKKHFPPDTQAAKYVIEGFTDDEQIENMTDEQLESERKRLIELLKESNDEDNEND